MGRSLGIATTTLGQGPQFCSVSAWGHHSFPKAVTAVFPIASWQLGYAGSQPQICPELAMGLKRNGAFHRAAFCNSIAHHVLKPIFRRQHACLICDDYFIPSAKAH